LYQKILEMITESILHHKDFKYPDAHLTWFLVSGLRNNKTMFLNIIDNKMGKDWD